MEGNEMGRKQKEWNIQMEYGKSKKAKTNRKVNFITINKRTKNV